MFEPILAFFRAYSVRQPLGGPRMRFGVVWFVVLLLALLGGSFAVTLVFGLVGATAGLQVAATWRSRKVAVNQVVAGATPGLLALAAWLGLRAVGLALIVIVAAALVLGTDTKPTKASLDSKRIRAALPTASATLRSGLFIGLAVAATVQVHRVDPMSFLFLMSVTCVYDCGDYLVGSGVRNRLVGPIAGLVGVAVVVLAMTAINPPPLTDDGDVRTIGLLMGLACPIGQMLGTWVLPSTRAKAPALRRLDSWLVAAPVCLIGLWLAT